MSYLPLVANDYHSTLTVPIKLSMKYHEISPKAIIAKDYKTIKA
jgi:hypothetical protein